MGCSSTICQAMKKLQKEQQIISQNEIEFQFVCQPPKPDTIPFMLFSNKKCQKPFTSFCIHDGKCITSQFFRLEKLDDEKCCAVVSLLEAVDMDGFTVDSCDEIYSLWKTNCCVVIDLRCFCVISPLPIKLVNRPLPIIEPKK